MLARTWGHRLVLVVGPAGAGKTTLLAQFAARAGVPVAWYRTAATDASQAAVVAHLERALTCALDGFGGGCRSPEELAGVLERWPHSRVLVVVDDLHLLDGTEGEATLGRLLDCLPPSVVMMAASRQAPSFNLSRLRVSGTLLEVGPADLRFRSWEVERLFHDFYREPLPPEDLAELARRTEGWAAGLQLFHLATRGKPPAERRRTLAAIGSRSRLVREYLTANVLSELPDQLRAFLVDTCVLVRLTGPLCDALRGTSGSERLLAELERRQIFTTCIDDEGTWRYHEVLRRHLESALVESVGEGEARRRHRRAGCLLEAAGFHVEALHAYCRGEDWPAAARLLGRQGAHLAGGPGEWIDALPRAIRDEDPWLRLAIARRHVAAGRWAAAMDAYQQARARFGTSAPAEICRRERQALGAWLEPTAIPAADWTGIVRSASRRDPLAALRLAAGLPSPLGRLAAGLCALLAGHVRGAAALLRAVVEHPEASPALVAGASLAAEIARLLGGVGRRRVLESAVEHCDSLGLTWLASFGRAVLGVATPGRHAEALAVRDACRQAGDPWGEALACLGAGLGGLQVGKPQTALLRTASETFRRLGARVLESWARAALAAAAARAGSPDARTLAAEAEALARATGAYGVLALTYSALGDADPQRAHEHRALAAAVGAECGLALPLPRPAGSATGSIRLSQDTLGRVAGELSLLREAFASFGPLADGSAPDVAAVAPVPGSGATPPTAAPVTLRCLGDFVLWIHGGLVDLSGAKPKVRSMLHLLAMHAGRPVHRETLVEALWPGVEARAGTRNLHVAVSSLRRLLEPDTARGAPSMVAREGDAYRLALPGDADVDLLAFERLLAEARTARASGQRERAAAGYEAALELYRGDLLPEEGPAEWVVTARERYRAEAVAAALDAAQLLLSLDRPTRAAQAVHRGLSVDRYRSGLWRMLVTAYERDHDPAAAARARRSYAAVLAELDIEDADAALVAPVRPS